MSPIDLSHREVQLAVSEAEHRAAQLLADRDDLRAKPFSGPNQAAISDHRTAAAGDMAEALDRIERGLGQRWMQAMFPEFDLAETTV